MSDGDLVVTVPKPLWQEWILEGDAVGEPETGEEWGFFLGGPMPRFVVGARLYVVAHDRLRGYAPITRIVRTERGFAICRRGGAVAVTILEKTPGFRGWRKRWWNRDAEAPFPEWKTEGVQLSKRELARSALRDMDRTGAIPLDNRLAFQELSQVLLQRGARG